MPHRDAAARALLTILNDGRIFNVAVNDVDMNNDELKSVIRFVYETAQTATGKDTQNFEKEFEVWLSEIRAEKDARNAIAGGR